RQGQAARQMRGAQTPPQPQASRAPRPGRCTMKARRLIPLLALVTSLALPTFARANFGIEPGSVTVKAINKDGTVDTLASSHPFAFSIRFKLNTDAKGHTEGGEMRDAIVDLPPGLVGNPQALPACSQQYF